MPKWMLRTAGAMLFSGFFLAAPASASPQVYYVRVAPPERVVEVRPVYRRGYVWQDGYYRWNGHRYVWRSGRYVRPPYPNAVWHSGRWEREDRGHYWIPGRWFRR
jgi:hypothetical protein